MTKTLAWDLVGGLGKPSKMPGYAYGLPAKECGVGSKLRQVKGSVCWRCYAFRGHYQMPNVQTTQYRRLAAIKDPRWVEAMVCLMHEMDIQWFRWHDSGDVQSPSHLDKICMVAEASPHVNFWLPTREKVFVYSHLKKHGAFPKNLVVRMSAAMLEGAPPEGFPHTSTVVSLGATCPAHDQGNHCGSCRACWDPKVRNVSYGYH